MFLRMDPLGLDMYHWWYPVKKWGYMIFNICVIIIIMWMIYYNEITRIFILIVIAYRLGLRRTIWWNYDPLPK